MIENKDSHYKPGWEWLGRSLANYIDMHPQAKGAKTLTEARRLAFGNKGKSFVCKCGQDKCKRRGGAKSSHC